MTFKSIVAGIFGSPAAKSVETFGITEGQKAVAALKTTSIGSAVAADIKAVASRQLTNSAKFDAVVANTAPLISNFLTSGGVATAVADVESIARALVQEIFNDTKSTKAASVARSVLALLGIKL